MSSALRTQIEFYFSDVNIVRDNFMKEQIADDEEGFVKISAFLNFKKVAALLKEQGIEGEAASIEAIAKALEGSETLALSENKLAVRRTNPLPDTLSVDAETAYVKFIPASASAEVMVAFFSKYGKVRAAWRRYGGNVPSGASSSFPTTADGKIIKESAFIVFENAESIKKLQDDVAANNTTFTGSETPLVVMPKAEYLAKKAAERGTRSNNKEGRSKAESANNNNQQQKSGPWPRDAAFTVKDCGTFASFRALKDLWEPSEQAGLRYVSINEDKTVATIIAQDSETREKLLTSVANREAKINEKQPTITKVPVGDEDEAAIAAAEKEIASAAANRNNNQGGRGGRGGGRGRGGRGGGRGRGFGGSRRQRD